MNNSFKKALVVLSVAAFAMLAGCSETVSLASHNAAIAAKAKEIAAKSKEAGQLTTELSVLKKENVELAKDLKKEVARKNQLAVENTRLLGRVNQGQKDLNIVAKATKKSLKGEGVGKKSVKVASK